MGPGGDGDVATGASRGANADAGEETREGIQAGGGEAIFVQADVSDEAAVRRAVASAVEAYGRLDSAFNKFGIFPTKQFEVISGGNGDGDRTDGTR